MKLKNKKTGEIVIADITRMVSGVRFDCGQSLAELNEEWEDVSEEYWYIDWVPEIGAYHTRDVDSDYDKRHKEIGNYFKTKEEAEKAVEKLKAWTRLKDKGFRFVGWQDSVSDNNPDMTLFKLNEDAWETSTCEDLDLLFGGEE